MAKRRRGRDAGRYWDEPRSAQDREYDHSVLVEHLRGDPRDHYPYQRRAPQDDYGHNDGYFDGADRGGYPAEDYVDYPPPRRDDYDRGYRSGHPESGYPDEGYDDPPAPRAVHHGAYDYPPPHRGDYAHADIPRSPEVRVADDVMAPRRGRRSLALRVALTAITAAALMGAAGAVYVAMVGGTLDAVLARSEAPEAQSAADTGSATAATVQAPTQLAQEQSQPVQQQVAPAPMPDAPAMVILIRNAIVALHQANTTNNYAVMRQLAAPGFQQANSAARLSEAFANLRGRGIDLGAVTTADPRLHKEPVVDQRGLLRLTGFFPVESEMVDFDLAFQMVQGRWLLFGIGVSPREEGDAQAAAPKLPEPPVDGSAVPSAPTMKALIRSVVIALNQANIANDYAVLRDLAAPGFQQANSADQLGAHFADLRARQLDLAPVAVIEPSLFRPATIDQRGFLRLTGFFPSRPEQVNFDLAFQFVSGEWQLFGIGLNTTRQAPAETAAASPQAGGSAPGAAEAVAVSPDGASPTAGRPPAPRLRPQL